MAKKTTETKVNKPMKENAHPFKVGAQYQNRDGDYHVISIDEPNMVIRYQDGRVIESSIALQARIWENIQEGNGDEIGIEFI
jgi:hypothetical protein